MTYKISILAIASALVTGTLSSFQASASYSDNSVNAIESASAVISCAKMAQLLPEGSVVTEVSGESIRTSWRVYVKTYLFKTLIPASAGNPPKNGPTLKAVTTVTEPSHGELHFPGQVTWSCALESAG